MSVRTKVLASGALAIAVVGWAGCGAWDAETRARDRAREWLDCPQVELTRYSEHAWRAAGCRP